MYVKEYIWNFKFIENMSEKLIIVVSMACLKYSIAIKILF